VVKVVEVTNVDFSLRHFLLPLMRGIRGRGHEVVGASADGPLLAVARAEGFRVVAVPLPRSLSPRANWRALWALVALFRRKSRILCTLTCRSAAFWRGWPVVSQA